MTCDAEMAASQDAVSVYVKRMIENGYANYIHSFPAMLLLTPSFNVPVREKAGLTYWNADAKTDAPLCLGCCWVLWEAAAGRGYANLCLHPEKPNQKEPRAATVATAQTD